MKRTTIYLDPDLLVGLKLESARSGRSMARVARAALREYLDRRPGARPPGAGAFASDRRNTARQTEVVLALEGFGRES